MKKSETANSFDGGLVMDLNPLVTPNNVLTNALNTTFITFNGNEYSLLNDMGNGRVETAYLPEGYIPLGTTELGGIIYIVSYNPLIGKCQIGSFPSPERNITTDELGESEKILDTLEFYDENGMIVTNVKKLILLDTELNPGDKFQIYCEQLDSVNYISAKQENNYNADSYPRYLKFNIVLVQDDGTITNLNDTLVWNDDNNYYILGNKITATNGKIDLDEYRNLITSNYNVVISNVSGKLAILAELEVIELFDVSWDAVKIDNLWNIYLFLNWNYDNENALDKINLYSVRVDCDAAVNTTNEIVIYDYPKSSGTGVDNDILNNEDTTFYTPCYVTQAPANDSEVPDYNTNNGITTPRYNNGSDNLFLLTTPIVLNEDAEGIVNFTIYPGMPFGYLAYLATTFSIDISKLGTGEIDLIEYRYYWNSNNITLNWGLDAYPERNKEIKSVTFEFYEFTQEIYDWICNNYINIDYNRGVYKSNETPTWEEPDEESTEGISSGSINFPNVSPYYTHTINNQSSYSGNFTDSITKLENYSLYLVRILINYNDEKYIEYYRFMYTSNIFNDYYYSSDINNDYKNIVLEDAIQTYRPYIFGYDNYKKSDSGYSYNLLNSDKDNVTSISKYLQTNTATENTYYVDYNYNCNLLFGLTGTVNNNSTFTVEFSNVNITQDSISVSTNSNITSLTNSSVSSATPDLEDISVEKASITELTKLNNIYNYYFELQLTAPLIVDYSNYTTISVDYVFLPITYITVWLLYYGEDTKHYVYVSRDYVYYDVKDYTGTMFSDDTRKVGPLSYYTDAYSALLDYLDVYDVVICKFRTHNEAKEDIFTSVGRTPIVGSGSDMRFNNQIVYGAGNTNESASIILYCFKNANDDVVPFVYGMRGRPGINNASYWYGRIPWIGEEPYDDSLSSTTSYNPFGVSHTYAEEDDYIANPISRYYKFSESSDTLYVMQWTKITYWDDYTWTANIPFNVNCNILLTINDVTLENINSHPNNLRYSSNQSFTVNVTISDSVVYSTYADSLSNTDGYTYYNEVTGEYSLGEIDVSSVYDSDMNVISYLKLDNGVSEAVLSNMKDSVHKIRVKNGLVQVTKGTGYADSQVIGVRGAEEEQLVFITGLIQINNVIQ